ncbi:MAG: GatB/YqeY domain-containing protein [Deltaproteobacteria bacterium]|nr:GatB/YqeY domain-containing protein [Deltaproteobacteria bacterium]
MNSLRERLDKAFKEAMKNKQAVALSTLRMLKTAVRHREVELKRPVTEGELQTVISTQAKQRREAMAEYTKARRPELAKKEEEELDFLLSFLPPQLSPEECDAEVARIIQEVGASGPKDLGKVMKAAMARLAGQADGKVIQEIAKRCLSA